MQGVPASTPAPCSPPVAPRPEGLADCGVGPFRNQLEGEVLRAGPRRRPARRGGGPQLGARLGRHRFRAADLRRDVRDGIRSLARRPAFTVVAVLARGRHRSQHRHLQPGQRRHPPRLAARTAGGGRQPLSASGIVRVRHALLAEPVAGAAGIGLTVWLLDLLATADLRLPVLVTLGLRLDARVLPLTLGVSVWPAPCWA